MATSLTTPTLVESHRGIWIYRDEMNHNTQNQAETVIWTVPDAGNASRWRLRFLTLMTENAATNPDTDNPSVTAHIRLETSGKIIADYSMGEGHAWFADSGSAATGNIWMIAQPLVSAIPVLAATDQLYVYCPLTDTNGTPAGDIRLTVGLEPVWQS